MTILPSKNVVLSYSSPRSREMSVLVATSAIFVMGCLTVVKAGHTWEASGVSSNPTTESSSGISRPRSRASNMTPAAMSSLLAKIAVGGFGSHVAQLLAEEGVFDTGLKFRSMVLPDTFIDQASPREMYDIAAMNADDIVTKVLDALGIAQLAARG